MLKAKEKYQAKIDATVTPPTIKWTNDSSSDDDTEEGEDFVSTPEVTMPPKKRMKREPDTSPIIPTQKKTIEEKCFELVVGCDCGFKKNLELAIYDRHKEQMVSFFNIPVLEENETLTVVKKEHNYKSKILEKLEKYMYHMSSYLFDIMEEYAELVKGKFIPKFKVVLVCEKQIVKEETRDISYHMIWLEGAICAVFLRCFDEYADTYPLELEITAYHNMHACACFGLPKSKQAGFKKRETIKLMQQKVKNIDIKTEHRADSALMVFYHLYKTTFK